MNGEVDQITDNLPHSRSWLPLSIEMLTFGSIIAVLWSPYYSPPFVVGPAGLVRADQILVPLLLSLLLLRSYPRIEFGVPLHAKLLTLLLATVFFGYLNGFQYLREPSGALYDVVLWAVYVAVAFLISSNVRRSTAERALHVCIVAGSLTSLLAIAQMYDVFGVNSWLSPLFTTGAHLEVIQRRVTGATANPNTYAMLMALPAGVMVNLLLVWLDEWARGERDRLLLPILGGVMVGILLWSIYATYSRTGAAVTLAALSVGFVNVLLTKKFTPRVRRSVASLALLGVGVVGVWIVTGVIDIGRYQLLLTPSEDPSLQSRLTKWKAAVPLLAEAPLFGHGPSRTGLQDYRETYGYIDSGLLRWWYSYGVAGVLAAIAFFAGGFRDAATVATSGNIHRSSPITWATANTLVGWCAGAAAVWMFVPVFRLRRSFVLVILLFALIFASISSINDES